PTAVDACTGTNLPVWVLSTETNGQCPQLITRTWAATNSCNTQFALCLQTVAVVDTKPPILTCTGAKAIQCNAHWEFDWPSAADACSGTNVNVNVLDTVTNNVCPLVVTRRWLATDACGNTNTCAQTVTARQPSLPRLICANNKVVHCASVEDF